MSTDRIERRIVLRAPLDRVWRALSRAQEFSDWFGVAFEGEFAPGARLLGRVRSPGYEHVTMEIDVERVEPQRLLSYRWHPNPVEPGVDYSDEPATLVEFHLEEVAEGTQLTVVESGFDRIPLWRRDEAFRRNEHGWDVQMEAIERYVTA